MTVVVGTNQNNCIKKTKKNAEESRNSKRDPLLQYKCLTNQSVKEGWWANKLLFSCL